MMICIVTIFHISIQQHNPIRIVFQWSPFTNSSHSIQSIHTIHVDYYYTYKAHYIIITTIRFWYCYHRNYFSFPIWNSYTKGYPLFSVPSTIFFIAVKTKDVKIALCMLVSALVTRKCFRYFILYVYRKCCYMFERVSLLGNLNYILYVYY